MLERDMGGDHQDISEGRSDPKGKRSSRQRPMGTEKTQIVLVTHTFFCVIQLIGLIIKDLICKGSTLSGAVSSGLLV